MQNINELMSRERKSIQMHIFLNFLSMNWARKTCFLHFNDHSILWRLLVDISISVHVSKFSQLCAFFYFLCIFWDFFIKTKFEILIVKKRCLSIILSMCRFWNFSFLLIKRAGRCFGSLLTSLQSLSLIPLNKKNGNSDFHESPLWLVQNLDTDNRQVTKKQTKKLL